MKILELIQFELSYAIAIAIIHSVWQSLLVMLLITGINKSNFFNTSKKKYALHVTGLFTLFALFLINIGLAILNPASMTELGISGAELVLANINSYILENSGISFSVYELIAVLWIIGVFVFFIKFAFGNLYLRNIRINGVLIEGQASTLVKDLRIKLGINQSIKLLQSNKITIPLTMGFVKPIIIFPISYFTNLSPAQLESIIIHELIHIKRNDYLINQIQSIIECVMFFNPFAWHISKQIRKYREYYCDDMVQSTIENKRIYLEALYKVARFADIAEQSSVALFQNKSELVMRVKRMLHQKTEDNTYKPLFSIGIMALLFFGFSVLSNANTTEFDTGLKDQVENFINRKVEIPVIEISELLVNDGKSMMRVKPVGHAKLLKEESFKGVQNALGEIPRSHQYVQDLPLLDMIISNEHFSEEKIAEFRFIKLDTVPDDKKIKELEMRLEEKAREMEELAVRFEKEISQNMEIETEKIEELARQLEERISLRSEEWSKNYENSELVDKIEDLARQLEQKIEAQMPELDELNKEEMKAFELKVEKLAQQMEQYIDEEGKVTDEAKIEALNKQISEESKKFKEVMSEFEKRHKEIFENVEIQVLQDQIKAMTKELSAIEIKHEEIFDPMSEELQAEIKILQEQLQANLKPMQEELQKQIQKKAMEMEKIAKEIEKERQKQKKQ